MNFARRLRLHHGATAAPGTERHRVAWPPNLRLLGENCARRTPFVWARFVRLRGEVGHGEGRQASQRGSRCRSGPGVTVVVDKSELRRDPELSLARRMLHVVSLYTYFSIDCR